MTEQPEQQPVIPTVVYGNDWRWNTQAPPPINGQVRTDNQGWAAATHVFIANVTDAGVDVGATLRQIVAGTNLDLAMRTDATRNVRYTVNSAPVAQATYVDVPVTYVQSAGTIPNSGTVITVTMVVPPLAGGQPITYRIVPVTNRYGRYSIIVSCPHGTLTELNATRTGDPALVPIVETTASNLLRKTACTCVGLVQAAAKEDDPQEAEGIAP